jgi:hypothetical protein
LLAHNFYQASCKFIGHIKIGGIRMRKTTLSTILLLTSLITSVLATGFIANVGAKHQAAPEYRDVYWSKLPPLATAQSVYGLIFNYTYQGRTYYNASLATTANELYGDRKCIVFVVEANTTTSDDPIIRVDVILPQDQTGNALFHLIDSEVIDEAGAPAAEWTSEIIEVDARQWIRSYRFKTDNPSYGIGPTPPQNRKLYFCLYFSEGEVECSYRFTIWTHDSQQESHSHYLWLNMDRSEPRITTVPRDADTVNGLLAPCGAHYFTLIVTAADDFPTARGVHDSGIKNATITIYNATNANDRVYQYVNTSINLQPGSIWIFQSNVSMTGRMSGRYNITVVVWDGVGNSRSITVTFTYIAPPAPLTITPSRGHAARDTRVINSATGLVQSYPETYKGKTLGTLVTVSGLQFGANLPVTVRVYIPTYHSYNATYHTYNILVNQTTTRADGTFTATFIFPEAPAGVYNVSAKTSVMECAVQFTVEPEVIYEPDEVMGPALITVKATGFTAQNLARPSWLFIVPDALQAVNLQVDRNWYIDGNGTLQNALNQYGAQCTPPEIIENTLYWPFAEPGNYTVEIKHVDGDYWNGATRTWQRIPCFAGSNIITVKDWTGDVIRAANNAAGNATQALRAANNAAGNATQALRAANNAAGNATQAYSEASAAKRAANNAAGNVTQISENVTAAIDAANNAKNAVAGLTIPVYLAVIFSLLAAIIAAACAVLVYRKIA